MTYPHTAGYAHGSETSQAAAESIRDLEAIRKAVKDLFDSGWEGTDWQLSQKLNLPYESVQPRRSELKEQGRVFDTGKRTNDSRSGKSAAIWAANQKLGGLEAPKVENGTGQAPEADPYQKSKKTALLTAHDSWGQDTYCGKDAKYWHGKVDPLNRALGRITAARTLEEAREWARKALESAFKDG